jgi:hypothetical protein
MLRDLDTKLVRKLGRVAHTCNPKTQRQKQKDQEFKASLGYIARLYLHVFMCV